MDWGQEDTGLSKGTIYSGAGHVGLILWVLVGDLLFPHTEPETIAVASVSIMTDAEFEAMQSSSPAPAETPAPEQPAAAAPEEVPTPPAVEPTVEPEPQPEPAPQPQPEPAVETPPTPEPVPQPPEPAPDDVVMAPDEQPIPTMNSSMRPKPKPAPTVAPDPVPVPEEVVTAETPTEAISEEPAETPPEVVEEPTQEAVAEETGDVLETEATEAQDEPLGMATSPRPKTKPNRPQPTETASGTPAETATEDATDAAAEAAIAAALAEAATAEDSAPAGGSTAPAASGPPMTGSEKSAVVSAINNCWNVGALSTAASRVKVRLRVEMNPDGSIAGITMADYSGGEAADAQQAFDAARRAVMRAAGQGCNGYTMNLDPAKYAEWSVMNLNFDASGAIMR